jgi:hypothetical protein
MGAFLVLALPLVTPSESFAGDQFNCVITGVGAFSANAGWYFQCDGGTRTGQPCSGVANQWGMYWADANSKEIYALALTFWMSGQPVRVNGTGACGNANFPGREMLNGLERYGM